MKIPPSLRYRQFAIFWIGIIFAWTANQVLIWAIPWHIRSFTANPLALGAVAVSLIAMVGERRRRIRAREEHRRELQRERLLLSLEALDASLTGLVAAALQGRERLEEERVPRLAQAINAANQSGDDDLRRLMEVVVACCDALGAAEREGAPGDDDFDRLVGQLGEAQRKVYRRIESLLEQPPD